MDVDVVELEGAEVVGVVVFFIFFLKKAADPYINRDLTFATVSV
ncbi:hypothetical protein [Staphylococcus aureus]